MASKIRYSAVAVVGILVASATAWWLQRGPQAQMQVAPAASSASAPAGASRPPAVEAATVAITRIVDDSQTVGSLRSRQSVVLRPEVSGRITALNFRDGERVRKGQLLVQFDDQLPRAQVQQSQAELSIATANHQRNQDLVAQNFISQRSVDESGANLQVAQAKLALARATAERLKIVAPFDAIAGIRVVNVGDYLKDGADIVNLEDLEAIYVDFRLPERFQTKLQRGQRASIDIDALPGRKFVAIVQAIDPLLDANGRSVGVRACIDNRQMHLRPGMFARVNTVFGEREKALVVPEEAIVPQGGKQFVLKLVPGAEADALVTQRTEVKVGVRRPGKVEILEGLNEGDRVVTAGQQRLQKDGTTVRVVDLASKAAAQPASAASAPQVAQASTPTAAPAKALAGPNPCLQAQAAGAVKPA
ncbi:membrane fusion protein, multidrug efflux system [Rhodoferax sp. OV413]|uniref:efflux RND transporter periplasmic adaptor subunit n=1 Tax=Rhodoferax sp. OV413 TaxID=1855285 RepID=UPI000889EAD5|nr:efflux RND transporter periplasmic adaptor subunit [Rhodoferax sp. OV413]SDP80679.1 membrane fusion protein, multidrug efflux system [Rhodoferax sp. OV413]